MKKKVLDMAHATQIHSFVDKDIWKRVKDTAHRGKSPVVVTLNELLELGLSRSEKESFKNSQKAEKPSKASPGSMSKGQDEAEEESSEDSQ